jgi:hypothetical protein
MSVTSKNIATDIALIEAHDARVEDLRMPMNGSCVVWFKHLAVYRARGSERFAIWSYPASLELRKVTRVIVDEAIIDGDYVLDGIILRGSEELPWQALLNPQAISRLQLTFGSGRRIEVDCEEAHLVLGEAVREIEEWIGPLV